MSRKDTRRLADAWLQYCGSAGEESGTQWGRLMENTGVPVEKGYCPPAQGQGSRRVGSPVLSGSFLFWPDHSLVAEPEEKARRIQRPRAPSMDLHTR